MTFLSPSYKEIRPFRTGVSEFINYHHVLWQFSTLGRLSAVIPVTFGGELRQRKTCSVAHLMLQNATEVVPCGRDV